MVAYSLEKVISNQIKKEAIKKPINVFGIFLKVFNLNFIFIAI